MSKPVKRPAFTLFFPLAALLASIAVPLSVWAVLSATGWPAGLIGSGHGFELIFGFALALIAGYTLGPQPARVLYPLVALWLAARLLRIPYPDNILALLLSAAFPLLLAWHVVPRFSAAKQWRNRMTAPLILTLCLLPMAGMGLVLIWRWSPALASDMRLDIARLMQAGVLCLLLLMSFIGGRIIAPAAAITLEKRGIELHARLQPRLEGALITLLALAVITLLMPWLDDRHSYRASGICLLAAALVLAVRGLRWQLWHCTARPDLLAFGIGYGWLAAGSLTSGLAFINLQHPIAALHLITIGGLGTLSTSVMLRLYYQRTGKTPPSTAWVVGITGLIGVASVARYLCGPTPFAHPLLLSLSAGSWALAYLLLALLMTRLSRQW
ncbi:MAG: NnrS family protein [Pseudomonas sp.]